MSTDRKGWREILGSRAKFVAAGIAGALRGLTPAVNARGLGGDRPQPVSVAEVCLLYTSPSPRDRTRSRMPSSA